MTWYFTPCTFSQEAEEEFSQTCCWDTRPSEPSKSKNISGIFCSADSWTEVCRNSQFGTMFKHSESITQTPPDTSKTLRKSEAACAFAADSPVKTFPLPEKAQASPEPAADYGKISPESLAKFDPDTRSWKTPQRSLFGEWIPFSETFPAWGMMLDGALYPQQTPARLIKGGAGGALLPTPTVCGNYNRKGASRNSGDGLATAVMRIPTPTVNPSKNSPTPSQMRRNSLNPEWVEWLMGWPPGWTKLRPEFGSTQRNMD